MADTVNTIPFYLSNESGSTLGQTWTGHYTSKDSKNSLQASMMFYGKPIATGPSLMKLGDISIVSSSSDYWSLFFTIVDNGNLYGYASTWYSCEASIGFKAVMLRVPSGGAKGILLGSSDGQNFSPFGNPFPVSTLTAV